MRHKTKSGRLYLSGGWPILIGDLGLSVAAVLEVAHLPADLFGQHEAYISSDQYVSLWLALEALQDKNRLPLDIARGLVVEAFDPALHACLASPCLSIALQRLARFKRLVGPLALDVTVGRTETRVIVSNADSSIELPLGLYWTELLFLLRFARLATRRHIVPARVIFPRTACGREEDRAFLGVSPLAGSSPEIVFRAVDAATPFVTANPTLWSFYEAPLERRLLEFDQHASVLDLARAALVEMLPLGQTEAEELARRLKLSKRSLQRGLSQAGTTFQQLLADTRNQLAMHYLRQAGLSQTEIAILVGFYDASSFARAFRRWNGLSPAAYQKQAARRDGSRPLK